MIELDPDDLAAASDTFPANAPLVLINLLRFHGQARHRGSTDLEPCTGREACLDRYPPAFARTVEPFGATELPFAGHVVARLVAPAAELWDAVAVVGHDSSSALRRFMTDRAYLDEAESHPSTALADWRLQATTMIS